MLTLSARSEWESVEASGEDGTRSRLQLSDPDGAYLDREIMHHGETVKRGRSLALGRRSVILGLHVHVFEANARILGHLVSVTKHGSSK